MDHAALYLDKRNLMKKQQKQKKQKKLRSSFR